MKILVTGGSGFVGSHLVRELDHRGDEVLVITRNPRNAWRLDGLDIAMIEGQLRDGDFVRDTVSSFAPSAIVHCGWAGLGEKNRNSEAQVSNLIIMRNILEAVVAARIPKLIGIGTQVEYGVHNKRLSEDTPSNTRDLYGTCKRAAGLLGLNYAEKYGFDYAWLRLFTAFGPMDSPNYILPYAIVSLLEGIAPELSKCEQMWDYLYVKDVARLIIKTLKRDEPFRGIYNLCSGKAVRLKDVILAAREVIGGDIKPNFGAVKTIKGDLFFLEGDNTRFKDTFGWIKPTKLKQAMAETVNWYQIQIK